MFVIRVHAPVNNISRKHLQRHDHHPLQQTASPSKYQNSRSKIAFFRYIETLSDIRLRFRVIIRVSFKSISGELCIVRERLTRINIIARQLRNKNRGSGLRGMIKHKRTSETLARENRGIFVRKRVVDPLTLRKGAFKIRFRGIIGDHRRLTCSGPR